jgi:hypothetical protein
MYRNRLTWVSGGCSMELELSPLEGALALIKSGLEQAFDSVGPRACLIERSSFVTDAIGPRAQHTVQPQATSIDELTKEVGNKRGFRRHREEIKSKRG